MWSKRNIEHAQHLIDSGAMTAAGLQQIQNAQTDGRWAAAYDKPSEMRVPPFFIDLLQQHPKAKTRFEQLNKTNTYAIAWRLQTAKTEATRLRRAEKIIVMLEAGQQLH